MGISRRSFLGLSGASVLAGLVKWVPKEDIIPKTRGHLNELTVANKLRLSPEQWFEQSKWTRMMQVAMWDALQRHCIMITRLNRQPMEMHIQWYKCDDEQWL